VAGVAGVRARPFFAATVIGYLPQTVIFAMLGSGVQIGRTAQLVTAAILFAAAGVVGWLLARKK
jgi:uncharacterized membrane protein YdjX (TVP38/TMEM64 family)